MSTSGRSLSGKVREKQGENWDINMGGVGQREVWDKEVRSK